MKEVHEPHLGRFHLVVANVDVVKVDQGLGEHKRIDVDDLI